MYGLQLGRPEISESKDTWGRTTSGKPYHIYLLAIACLLEVRLGDKIFIYGDITRSQCLQAIELINQYLDEPIHLPSRCVPARFYERVERLPFSTEEKQKIYASLLLGENADELLIRRLYERGKVDKEYDISDYEDLLRYKPGGYDSSGSGGRPRRSHMVSVSIYCRQNRTWSTG
mgnify:CR=1 FL=1